MIPGISAWERHRIKPFSTAHNRRSHRTSSWRHHHLTKASLGRSEGPWRPQKNLATWQKIGSWLATAGFAAALSFTCVTQSVLAVTNEQLLFLEAWRAVDRAYYDKNFNGKPWFRIREQYMKDKALGTRQETYAAIRSLLAELDDPFTRFLEPTRYAALKRGTAGSLTGVGLEVGFDMAAGSDSELVVITPSADGPADKAGIKPRDKVVAIDGKTTVGLSLYDAGELLQGAEGSQVTLTIQSQNEAEPREVQLSRQRIINNPVSSQLCQKVPLGEVTDQPESIGKVGYIRVATFSKQTTDNVKTALHKLQAEHADMVILDIRNNGGGLFPAGVEVARTFMNDGDIVLIADSQGVRDSYPASNIAVEPKKPLSVLVNRGTASASEVLAGALQDNGRAKIVGETTFGKGLIQTIVELSDGSGVAVTVARYQTPLGTDINKKGIQPDILIKTGDMPPTNGPGFCRFVASRGAAVLFDANAAAKMPSGGFESSAGESMPIDVTQYENAFISGPSENSVEKKAQPKEEQILKQDNVKSSGQETSEDGPKPESAENELTSKSEASSQPQPPQQSTAEANSLDSQNKIPSSSESTSGEQIPDSPADGRKASPEPLQDSPGENSKAEEPKGDAEGKNKIDPPIADKPAPVENVSKGNDIEPSPVSKEKSPSLKKAAEPVSFQENGTIEMSENDQSLSLGSSASQNLLVPVPFVEEEFDMTFETPQLDEQIEDQADVIEINTA